MTKEKVDEVAANLEERNSDKTTDEQANGTLKAPTLVTRRPQRRGNLPPPTQEELMRMQLVAGQYPQIGTWIASVRAEQEKPKKRIRKKPTRPAPPMDVTVHERENDLTALPIDTVKKQLVKRGYHPAVIDRMPEWYNRSLLRDLVVETACRFDLGNEVNDVMNEAD